jgi:hypothetical protein
MLDLANDIRSLSELSYGRKPHTYRVFFTVDVDAGGVCSMCAEVRGSGPVRKN